MNDRLDFYLRSQLLGQGLAIINPTIANRLSVGLWPSVNNVMIDFMDVKRILARYGSGCEVLDVELDGEKALVLARSSKSLKSRIEMLTGLKVDAIAPHVTEEAKAVPVVKVADPNTSKLERELRKDFKRQVAEHADFERRKQSLAKGEQHRQWLEQRRVDAENSRQEFYSKRNGNG